MTTAEPESVAVRPDFDHSTDPALIADHYAEWLRLQAECPAFKSEVFDTHDLWYVLRYDEMHEILRDPARFSSRSVDYTGEQIQRMIPIEMDPPEHGRYRQLLTHRFSPHAVARLEPEIRRRCVELIEGVIAEGECDYTRDVAFRFPTAIFLEMMGLDVARTDELTGHAKVILDPSHSDEDRATAAFSIVAVLMEGFAARREEPRDDVLTELVQATIDGQPLSDEDLLAFGFLLYLAGLDTVANVLSYSMRHLAQVPDLRHELTAEPDRWPAAVEELLRYYTIPSVVRVVAEDTEMAGCPMKAGDRVVLPLAAADRDPRAFDRADEFDPGRVQNRHLAFGAGPHRCLGAHLARLELRVAMEEWHARIPDYSIPDGTTFVEHVGAVAGLDALPLAWTTEETR
ncbi:MAG TPA: cytochrome P450 [Acidimicrobiales bacterium]|nr:cytochrome P450 [Acidimicrobiales bacterium]